MPKTNVSWTRLTVGDGTAKIHTAVIHNKLNAAEPVKVCLLGQGIERNLLKSVKRKEKFSEFS